MDCVTPAPRDSDAIVQHILTDQKMRGVASEPSTSINTPDIPTEINETWLNQQDEIKSLDSEQRQVIVSLMVHKRNVLMTAPAGSGKTHTINALRTLLAKCGFNSVHITATTGIAATHISGTTLHSFIGAGLAERPVPDLVRMIRKKEAALRRWKDATHLIVDELSMQSPELFVKMDQLGRILRNCPKPFGGILLLVSGDFLQLGPPKPADERLKQVYQLSNFKELIPVCVVLTHIYRQSDPRFVALLQNVRVGQPTPSDIALLQSRVCEPKTYGKAEIAPTVLYSKNINVKQLNDEELSKLCKKNNEEPTVYNVKVTITCQNQRKYQDEIDAFIKNESLNSLLADSVSIAVGAQVMLVSNIDPDWKIANGSRGVVVKWSEKVKLENHPLQAYPVVKFQNGKESAIFPFPSVHALGKDGKVVREQVPLRLAWAITIHKAQGLSMDYVRMNLSDLFTAGQAYTALSRARTLDGLELSAFSPKCIFADKHAIQFYKDIARPKQSVLKFSVGADAETTPVPE